MEQAQVNLCMHSFKGEESQQEYSDCSEISNIASWFLKLATFSVFHIVAVTILLNWLYLTKICPFFQLPTFSSTSSKPSLTAFLEPESCFLFKTLPGSVHCSIQKLGQPLYFWYQNLPSYYFSLPQSLVIKIMVLLCSQILWCRNLDRMEHCFIMSGPLLGY